jgi:hypothetical protein
MAVSRQEVVKIENTEFVRDMSTKAVLNTDVGGLHRYREGRKRVMKDRQDTLKTKERLSVIEQEVTELKQLVSELATMRSIV